MHSSLQDGCLPAHLSPAPSEPWAVLCGALNTLLLVLRAPVLNLPYLTLGTSTHTCHSGCPAVGTDSHCPWSWSQRQKLSPWDTARRLFLP